MHVGYISQVIIARRPQSCYLVNILYLITSICSRTDNARQEVLSSIQKVTILVNIMIQPWSFFLFASFSYFQFNFTILKKYVSPESVKIQLSNKTWKFICLNRFLSCLIESQKIILKSSVFQNQDSCPFYGYFQNKMVQVKRNCVGSLFLTFYFMTREI